MLAMIKVDLRKISDVKERNYNNFYLDTVKVEIQGNKVVKIQSILTKKRILQIVKINYQKQNGKYVTQKYIESIYIFFL